MAAFVKVHEIGDFAVCRHTVTAYFYVYGYDKESQKTFHYTLGTKDLEAAIAAVRSLVERGITGDPKGAIVQKPIRTVAELLEFVRPLAEQQASAEFNKIAIERMERLMGSSVLQYMVISNFERFRDAALAEGIKLSTVDRTLTLMRTACARAISERRLPRHHAPTVPYFFTKNHARAAPPKGRLMEIEEIASVIDQAQFLHFLIAVVWLINLASRVGALLDAVAAQIDERRGLIDLNPAGRIQTSKWRPVLPIPATLLPWTFDLPPGHLIQWRGQPVGEIDTAFAAACRRARLAPGANTYSLRHALGRYMRSKAVPDDQIALFMGHIQPPESVQTTLIYSPYSPTYLRDAKAAAEGFVREIARHCRKHDVLQPPWLKDEEFP
jgi:integrase